MASKDGYQTAQTGPVTINDADVEGVEIVLETGASVHGEVVDPQGNPMPDISVTAQGDAGASSGDTDAYGRFRIEGLGPGCISCPCRITAGVEETLASRMSSA